MAKLSYPAIGDIEFTQRGKVLNEDLSDKHDLLLCNGSAVDEEHPVLASVLLGVNLPLIPTTSTINKFKIVGDLT